VRERNPGFRRPAPLRRTTLALDPGYGVSSGNRCLNYVINGGSSCAKQTCRRLYFEFFLLTKVDNKQTGDFRGLVSGCP